MKVAIIDYKMGNLASVKNALDTIGVESVITNNKKVISESDAIIFPGVGAAKEAIKSLIELDLIDILKSEVQKGKPFLGICLGMQLLLTTSEEGNVKCLNLIPGIVRKFNIGLKIPQIGWNMVNVKSRPRGRDSCFYFVHSYYCDPEDKSIIIGTTNYGIEFCSILQKNNITGFQFHPEKSGEAGLKLLKNWCNSVTMVQLPNRAYQNNTSQSFQIIPAIDIKDGKCVRLTKGDFNSTIVYKLDPIEQAMYFKKQGAEFLHIVDLDGAKEGYPENFNTIKKILSISGLRVEIGGGIRTIEDIKNYLKYNPWQIILGSSAVNNTRLIKSLRKNYNLNRFSIAVDVKNGFVASKGWLESSNLRPLKFIENLSSEGFNRFIVTDISKDGTFAGPNLKLALELKNRTGTQIIVSGGVKSEKDIKNAERLELDGIVVGKAIYEEKINLNKIFKEKPRFNNLYVRRDIFGRRDLEVAPRDRYGLTKRIIPCLDIKNGKVVKGINFKNLKNSGDPVDLAKYYYKQGADELVFLDITASNEKRKTTIELAKKVAKEISIPFTIGGGIRTVEDIREIVQNGADKVSLNTAAVLNPNLIKEGSKKFGSQCIVVAIDTKRVGEKYKVFINSGTKETNLEAIDWAKKVAALGAGEILLTSIDGDGTQKGYDLKITKTISEAVNIPVIASGGAGSVQDLYQALTIGKADAVLLASLLHENKLTIKNIKDNLINKNISIRIFI